MSKLISNCGFVSKDDLIGTHLNETLMEFEPIQAEFLELYSNDIPYIYKNKWPIDKLHWWSRPEEYRFILSRLLSHSLGNSDINILEFGPGCSFIPFYLDKKAGLRKLFIQEIDNSVITFWRNFSDKTKINITEHQNSEFKENFYDIIYSVSVIEHVEDPVDSIINLIKQLKSGGSLILTLDIDLSGKSKYGLSEDQLKKVMSLKQVVFENAIPLKSFIHPRVIATPSNGWIISNEHIPLSKFMIFKNNIKNIIKKIMNIDDPSNICVLKIMAKKI